jgi:microsomal dipeptidase-like Zn-dependent dipeptidase
MINAAEGRLTASQADLGMGAVAYKHGSDGGPSFQDFPSWQSGSHEQYHITQIYRAYLGGMRLMSAMAVHNQGLEYGMGWVRCNDRGLPTVDTTPDWTVIKAHVRAMRQLAELNRSWMEIAYTPAEARRIIRANKLAVVLGTEVPQLGLDDDGDPATQVHALEALGIRQVILVHGMDNYLGGTALFQDLYNSVNDWLYRPVRTRDRVETLSGGFDWRIYPASFYQVTTSASPPVLTLPVDEPIEMTEPILFRLGNPLRLVLSDIDPRPPSYQFIQGSRFGPMHPLVSTHPINESAQNPYGDYVGGHRNVRGLTGRGAEFVERLMQHGMLVDLAHMSDATLANVYDVADSACPSYPLMISHAHFRPLALQIDYSDLASAFVNDTGKDVRDDMMATPPKPSMSECIRDHSLCNKSVLNKAKEAAHHAQLGPGTTIRQNLPREYDIASSEIQQVRERNGVIGPFLGQGALDPHAPALEHGLPGGLTTLPLPLNCAGSSQGFAAALLFANARMKGKGGIGFASDYTFTVSEGARFGPAACASGYLGAGASSGSGAQLLEVLLDPDQYRFDEQKDAVNYSPGAKTCVDGQPKMADVACGSNAPIDPYVMGDRTYDFNVDGFAQYGLVPDMLQDVANQLHDARHVALDQLFNAANAYLEMWSAARAMSRCEADGLCPEVVFPPDPQCSGALDGVRAECGNSCPCAWNRGAPLHELQEVMGACDTGQIITLPVMDPSGSEPTALEYEQRRTSLADPGNLTEQGDWAVYRIQPGQTWKCGSSAPRTIGCPTAANYVKIRRILDTTVSRFTDRCDYQPLPPENGNRSVLFQCLVAPKASTGGVHP